MSLQSDPQKAVEFLRFMYPEGPWVLTAIPVERPEGERQKAPPTETFYPGDDVAAWLRKYEGRTHNFYWSVNRPKTPCTKKASRLEIEDMCFLHVDVDPRTPDPDADKAQHNLDERNRIEALFSDKLPEGVPKPSAVMYSGGGYWGLWRLTEPFPIRESADRYEEAKLYNLQLELLFGADSCHNVDRIARLPGTINYPDEKKRAKGRTAALAEVVYTADDAHPLSDFTKAPQVQAPRTNTKPATIDQANVKRIRNLDELPKTVPLQTKTMISLGHDPDDMSAGNLDKEGRSGPLFHVCCELVRQGVPDETIYSLITDPDWEISKSVIDGTNGRGDGYALRQIARAREFAVDPVLVELNDEYAVVQVGGKFRVMRCRSGRVEYLQKDAFLGYWNKRRITIPTNNGATEKPLGSWWLDHPLGRAYRDVVYEPGGEVGDDVFNLWRGFRYEPGDGDCSLYLDHLRENVCDGVEEHFAYLIRWMAYAVQNPGEPGHVAVVVKGKKGVGKGVFAEHFGALWGRHFVPIVNPEHMTGFNGLVGEASVLFLDEALVPKGPTARKHESILKALVTGTEVNVERKGVDAVTQPNYLHIILASNDEWVVPASDDERRYFFLHVGERRRKDVTYFAAMARQMEAGGYRALLKLLLEMDLSDFEVRLAPTTAALREQMELSLEPMDEWLLTLLDAGTLPNNAHEQPDRAWVRIEMADTGLYEHAKKAVPRLREVSDTALGRFLSKHGIESPENGGRRTRQFPPLADLRRGWCERFGPREWPGGSDATWSPVEYDDDGVL